MTLFVYIVVGIVAVHAVFLLFPAYRSYSLEGYKELPWTEHNYLLFKECLKDSSVSRKMLLKNWLMWPIKILVIVLPMPVWFLYDRPWLIRQSKEEQPKGTVHYSEDGQTLVKIDRDLVKVEVKPGTKVIAPYAVMADKECHNEYQLEEIILPESLERIEDSAFGPNHLRKLELPENLHFVGTGAFWGCFRLEELVMRGDFDWDNTWIEEYNPFYNTSELRTIINTNPHFVVEDGLLMSSDRKVVFCCLYRDIEFLGSAEGVAQDVSSDSEHFQEAVFPRIEIPDGVEVIAQGAFSERIYFEEITFPQSVRVIGNDAFRGALNLDKVVFPKRLSVLGEGAFCGCYCLKTMVFPLSIDKIEDEVFFGDDIESINVPDGADAKVIRYAEEVLRKAKQECGEKEEFLPNIRSEDSRSIHPDFEL